MHERIEWNFKASPNEVKRINETVTPEMIAQAVRIAYPQAEVTFEKVKANCEAHGEKYLPFDNFLEIAFQNALKDQLRIKPGDMLSFAFKEWYSAYRQELTAYLK